MVILDMSYLSGSDTCGVQQNLNGQTVLITAELIYEIMTNSKKKDPREYLDKLAGLDLVQSRSLAALVKNEIATSQRVTDIVDPVASKHLVDFVNNGKGIGVAADVGSDIEHSLEKDEPQQLKKSLDQMWEGRFDEIFSTIECADLAGNARSYNCIMGQLIGKSIADEYKRDITESCG